MINLKSSISKAVKGNEFNLICSYHLCHELQASDCHENVYDAKQVPLLLSDTGLLKFDYLKFADTWPLSITDQSKTVTRAGMDVLIN